MKSVAKIYILQSSVDSFKTILKDHDAILSLYGKSVDLNGHYQREILDNKQYINNLERKVHNLQEERNSLQLAIKLIAQDKYCPNGNETRPFVPGFCPGESNKLHTNNKQCGMGNKSMQSNTTPSVTLINIGYGSTIHHLEQNHDSEIIKSSQVAHISQ